MIINPSNTELRLNKVLDQTSGSSFINVGGSLGAQEIQSVTHYADLQRPQFKTLKPVFIVDIGNPLTWRNILDWVNLNGKFDFSICTQTLEHVANINCALNFLSRIAIRGFVSVPSKYTELKKGVSYGDEGLSRCNMNAHYRGFLPHRWIFTVRQNGISEEVLWAFPKLNFIEYMNLPWVDKWESSCELSFEWENSIPLIEINDTFLDHPDPQKAIDFYYNNLQEGL